jgi:hypothetical protein
MIALALVLALTVISWASLSPLRDRVAMEEATAMVADGVERARSLAANSNQVLEVRASIEATALEIQARTIAADEDEDEDGEGAGEGRGGVGEGEERPWSVLVRIVGSFAREDPMESGSGSGGDDAGREAFMDGEPEFVSIGVVLPDGSMVAGVPLRLKDSEGRWSVVRVGTWTTRIEVEAGAEGESGSEEDSMPTEDVGVDEGDAEAEGAAG